MAWPEPTEYHEAIQSPQLCFADDELRHGQPVTNALGLPVACAGNFALVYQVTGASGQSWAVKCFIREAPARQQRYQAISEHLRQAALPFMVDFGYLEQGIRVGGQWYPAVKMRWVEGFTLNALLRDHTDRPQVLQRLAQMWLPLAQKLRRAGIAHADLQHGNVLLVPSQKAATVDLRLIDYDGMFVPALAQTPSGELGHPNYQHPERLAAGTYHAEVDRFAHLVIYTALRCLPVGGKALWQKYDNAENLLFREQDFKEPASSKLFAELWELDDPDARALVGHLLLASQEPLDSVPLLEDLVDGGHVLALTPRQLKRVRELLPCGVQAGPVPVEVVPAPAAIPTAEKLPAGGVPSARATKVDTGADKQTAVSVGTQPAPVPAAPAAPPDKTAAASANPVAAVTPAARPRRKSTLKAPAAARKREPREDDFGPSLAARRRLIGLAAVGGVALCGLIVTLALTLPGSGEPTPPGAPGGGPRTAKPGLALKLDRVEPVTLKAGGAAVPVTVRLSTEGAVGRVKLEARDLPAHVLAEPVTLEPGQTEGVLELRAGLTAPAGQRPIRVVARTEEQNLEQAVPVALTVAGQDAVNWAPLAPVVLAPGERKTVPLRLQPARHEIPLKVVSAGPLPPKVTLAGLKPLAPGQAEAALTFEAARDAPAGLHVAALALEADGAKLLEQKVTVRVVKPSLTILPVAPQRIPAGGYHAVPITVQREGCEEDVSVTAVLMPANVHPVPYIIRPGVNSGVVPLSVPERAAAQQELLVTARMVTRYSGVLEVRQKVSITVTGTGAAAPATLRAAGEPAPFESVDGVQLRGTFYRAARGRDAPCVLLLPPLGQSSRAAPWPALAEKLQQAGCAVLAFDYRGVGDSTVVNPRLFWAQRANVSWAGANKRGRPAESIDFVRFNKNYYPVLANDIAAAKAYLDEQSDRGLCDSGNLILIGAGDGATLAALWLNAEHCRYRQVPGSAGLAKGPDGLYASEGRHVTAIVCVSPRPLRRTLDKRSTSLAGLLAWPATNRRLPVALVYGADDAEGKKVALACVAGLKKGKLRADLGGREFPTAAAGNALLEQSAEALAWVADYAARQARERDPIGARIREAGNRYVWFGYSGQMTPARQPGQTRVMFNDFATFLRY